jgi:hypothetical protein
MVSLRARWRRPQLDAALAAGADPWSSPELLVRAAQLGLRSERRKLATRLYALVALATGHGLASPFLTVRRRVVLEQRELLVGLAQRLFQPAPVDVAVVAQLAVLLSDRSSPVYEGGTNPSGLAEMIARCQRKI